MIGVMSDSHDHLEGIGKAVEFFNASKADMVLHAGDIISPFTVKEFARLKCPLKAVYGNNDGERKILAEKLAGIGAEIDDILELEFQGKKICLYHGTHEELVHALVESKSYDVVVRGHSHKTEVSARGSTLVINPGETCGYLTGKKTVALLDVVSMEAEMHEL